MPKTLLLADDSVVIQKLVGLSFANEDVEIIATDNGDDAVTKARDLRPDVILADVVMPGKSGYEVCEAIKQDPNLSHIPVLLLTGTFESFDEARAEQAGSDGQITKPFEAQALVERVNDFMNRPAATPSPAPVATQENATPALDVTPDVDISSAMPAMPPVAATPISSEPVAPVAAASDSGVDFFDSDVTNLTPSATDFGAGVSTDGLASDLSSSIPPVTGIEAAEADPGTSGYFGAPGDGASEDLDEQGGGLALGERVAVDSAATSDSSLGAPSVDTPDADATIAVLPAPTAPTGFAGDPLEDLNRAVDLDDSIGLPTASAVDLDAALDAASPGDDATILVADNGSTSPNMGLPDLADPLGASGPNPISNEADDLTQFSAAPIAPPPEAMNVTNLDDSLGLGTTPPPLPSSSFEASAATSPPAIPQTESIDLGPEQVGNDDLDFGFDVSEQAPVDPLEESFSSSLMDIAPPTLVGSESIAALPVEDSIAEGYDVSSSELVDPTSEDPVDPGSPLAAPVVSPLVGPWDSSPADSDAGSEATIVAPIGFEDMDTPDAARPMPPRFTPNDDLLDSPQDMVALTDVTDTTDDLSAEALLLDDDGDDLNPLAGSHDAEPDHDFALGLASLQQTGAGSDRVSDLSPMMEERIRETLEKVAWEAFSDLSESIVKQVLGRVEQIAWEVIPQMAETLVREEIRRMKGDDD